MTFNPTRRSLASGLLAVIPAGLRPSAKPASPDPIYDLIERHRIAFHADRAARTAHGHARNEGRSNLADLRRERTRTSKVRRAAYRQLCEATPETHDGYRALSAHLHAIVPSPYPDDVAGLVSAHLAAVRGRFALTFAPNGVQAGTPAARMALPQSVWLTRCAARGSNSILCQTDLMEALVAELSRSDFCEVTSVSSDALASLGRRGQLPFSIDQKTYGRGYSFFEAFMMIVTKEFTEGHGVNVYRSAEIAGALPDVLAPKWVRVVETADAMVAGTGERVEEVMCGRYDVGGLHQPRPMAGTNAEIERDLAKSGDIAIRSIRSSASRSLALLLNRCHRRGIEVPAAFLSGPFVYRPRIDAVALGLASMQHLVNEPVHSKGTEE